MTFFPAPRLTPDRVQAAVAAGTGERVALFGDRASVRVLAETAAALANAQGGMMVLGATAAHKAPGLADGAAAREKLAAAALQTEPPLLLAPPALVDVAGARLAALEIPPGLPHVYSVRGQYLIRSGPANRPLSGEELRQLLHNRAAAGFEAQVLPGAGWEDLDQERVAAHQRLLGGLAAAAGDAFLLSRGCVAKTTAGLAPDAAGVAPTVAGLLLFGRDPQRWLRSAEITCVRYVGAVMSDDFVREDVRGVLPDQIRRAEAFVSSNMRRGMRLRGLAREEAPEYPISVVREAIVNAVAHRDYSVRGDNIRVLMFSDRLEVYSPGRLPGHVTLANLLEERYSRNEALVQVLSEMGFIERLGYGIDRMLAVCSQEGLESPRFEETAGGFRVTIFGHGPRLMGAAPPTTLWATLHLNPRQEALVTHLQAHRRITNREYQQLCPDASAETLRRDFADLVDRGFLLKIGEKRATYYVLK